MQLQPVTYLLVQICMRGYGLHALKCGSLTAPQSEQILTVTQWVGQSVRCRRRVQVSIDAVRCCLIDGFDQSVGEAEMAILAVCD